MFCRISHNQTHVSKAKAGGGAILVAMALMLVVSIAPAPAWATGNTTYDFSASDQSYNCMETDESTVYYVKGTSSSHHLSISGGTSDHPIEVHLLDLSLDASDSESPAIDISSGSYAKIFIDGTVTLWGGVEHNGIFEHDYGYAALHTADAYVQICGAGSLTATGGDDSDDDGGAGIGGNDNEACGSVTIGDDLIVRDDQDAITNIDEDPTGPTVVAQGGGEAAGIGTGDDWSDGLAQIAITGGNVTATAGHDAAGIGCGNNVTGKLESITISGGTVSATSTSTNAAGIGAGSSSDVGTIDIEGNVNVTATATGENGAGIGAAKNGSVGSITVKPSAGSVTATSTDDGAGIGAADGGDVESVTVSPAGAASVSATSASDGAGIGCSADGEATYITVAPTGSSTVTAQGGSAGAGIGGSDGKMPYSTIVSAGTGATVEAQGGMDGAGIGGGDSKDGLVSIPLQGGTITATGGDNGAGIGGGNEESVKIAIGGSGTLNATSGKNACGIGSAHGHASGTITIDGDGVDKLFINADSSESGDDACYAGAAIGSCQGDGGDILILDATVKAIGNCATAVIGSGYASTVYGMDKGGTIDTITLSSAHVIAYSDNGSYGENPGIGAACSATVNHIVIENSTYEGPSIGSVGVGTEWGSSGLNDIKSISITNSTVTATAESSGGYQPLPQAGIGTGPDGDVGSITISQSNVTATGADGGPGIGCGGGIFGRDEISFLGSDGGEIESIDITGSTVVANGSCAGLDQTPWIPASDRSYSGCGAGIGSGGGAACRSISIDESTVTATGGGETSVGAAGIGSGSWGDSGTINITDSTVNATGGYTAAGIGSGGFDFSFYFGTPIDEDFDDQLNGIDIDTGSISLTGSNVTAKGGSGAAGIGAGQDAKTGDTAIDITSSVVDATGGKYGSGIGGGRRDDGNMESTAFDGTLSITWNFQVTARGGYEGAGIGGGSGSGATNLYIDLAPGQNADDSFMYYVKAYGGVGAAGIGTGAYNGYSDDMDVSVTIAGGGYIYAEGGTSSNGGGAGIGTGAGDPDESRDNAGLDDLVISGGFIEAVGGTDAVDIGAGTNVSQGSKGTWDVVGGTVIADTWSHHDVTIDGGSVSAKLSQAKDSSGDSVYQTTLKTFSALTPVCLENISTAPSYSGNQDLYSDEGCYLYPYLPVTKPYGTTKADLMYEGGEHDTDVCSYSGTTSSDNSGWLKMNGMVSFNTPLGIIYPGETFMLSLDDDDLTDTGWSFSADGAASVVKTTQDTSPGACVEVQADKQGTFTVEAVSTGTVTDSELYWDHSASYTGTVAAELPTVTFTENPSKTYDATPASNPSVSSDSDGTVSYSYRDAQGTWSDAAPTNAGTYTVRATVSATEHYSEVAVEEQFTIAPASTSLVLTAAQDGTSGTVTATVAGLYSGDGSDGTVIFSGDVAGEVDLSDGKASIMISEVASGTYTVSATYESNSGNYVSSTGSETFDKTKPTITIEGTTSYSKDYGDDSFTLDQHVSDSSIATADCTMTYTVIWDSASTYGLEPSVSVDSDGVVSVNHAGKAVIRVDCHDSSGWYEDASVCVTVEVAQAALTVTSTASVKEATYGSLDGVTYSLSYAGFKNGDTPESSILGTLSVAGLSAKTGASETPYKIGITRTGADVTINGITYDDVFISRDYLIALDEGSLKVNKAALTVAADDATGTYGGTEPIYTCSVTSGLVSWDTEQTAFTTAPSVGLSAGAGTYDSLGVGTHEDVIVPSNGESSNYTISYEPATLTVEPESLSDTSRVNAGKFDVLTYDGSDQSTTQAKSLAVTDGSTSLVLGTDYTMTFLHAENGSLVAGTAADAGNYVVRIDGTGNYTGTIWRILRIKPATLSVVTEDAEKIYDGSPLTAAGSLTGLVGGEDASLDVTGSQTAVGSSTNTYEIAWDGTAKESNYVVSEDLGTLRVLSNDMAACSVAQLDDCTYDGTPHEQTPTVTDPSGVTLTEGTDYRLTYSDDVTDAGQVTITIEGMGHYTGTTQVTYEIEPTTLSVTTSFASKTYDGTPLVGDGTMDGLVNGETATFEATGSITDAGSVTNGYAITWDGTAVEGNYVVEEDGLGTLAVYPTDAAQQSLSATGYHGTYDGLGHQVEASASLEGSTLEYSVDDGATWSTESPAFVDATDGPQKVMVRATNANYAEGTATQTVYVAIDRATLEVVTDSAQKVADGTPLTAGGSVTGLKGTETLTFQVTGSQTEVGSSTNSYSLTWDGSAKECDYTVHEELGSLQVVGASSGVTSSDSDAGTGSDDASCIAVPRTADPLGGLGVLAGALAVAGAAAIAITMRCRRAR